MPRTLRILVAALPAVIGRIGIDEDAGCSVLLRDERLYPTEIHTITHQHDLSVDIDLHLRELVEVFRRAVVGIDDGGFHVAGRRHAVEWHDDARIILERITFNMLARWSVHVHAFRRGDVDANLHRIVEPDFVFDNFGIETRLPKLRG